MMTIKEYADSKGISYEAVRRQVSKYNSQLKQHITVKNRTQYLDDYAVEFLSQRRRDSPIILVTENQQDKIDKLTAEVEKLRGQLVEMQKKVMESQEERLKAQDRIIALQEESRKTLMERAEHEALLEEVRTAKEEAASLRIQADVDRQTIDDLRKERDEATKEAQSFTRSIFGFYRKRE